MPGHGTGTFHCNFGNAGSSCWCLSYGFVLFQAPLDHPLRCRGFRLPSSIPWGVLERVKFLRGAVFARGDFTSIVATSRTLFFRRLEGCRRVVSGPFQPSNMAVVEWWEDSSVDRSYLLLHNICMFRRETACPVRESVNFGCLYRLAWVTSSHTFQFIWKWVLGWVKFLGALAVLKHCFRLKCGRRFKQWSMPVC